MAKITIEIEDIAGDKVSIKSNPTVEDIFKRAEKGDTLTSAHGYAFVALNTIRKQGKSKEPNKIIIPKKM